MRLRRAYTVFKEIVPLLVLVLLVAGCSAPIPAGEAAPTVTTDAAGTTATAATNLARVGSPSVTPSGSEVQPPTGSTPPASGPAGSTPSQVGATAALTAEPATGASPLATATAAVMATEPASGTPMLSATTTSSATPGTGPTAAAVMTGTAGTPNSPATTGTPAAGAAATPDASTALAGKGATPEPGILYQDDFKNPKSGWPDELVFQDYYVGYHEPDFYHVEVHVPHDSAIVTAPGQSFDNFSEETKVQVSIANTAPSGDFRYGLVARRSGNRYYALTISPRTKTWYVLKSGGDRLQVMSQGTQDSIHGLQGQDTLRVNALGPVMAFFVNGQQVSQISDADYPGGSVGFYVETFDSPKAHIHYDDLVVHPPENVPIAAKPSPTPVTTVTCSVVANLLKLRPSPSFTSEPAIAGLFQGTQLDAYGRSADGTWLRVGIHGGSQEGWVSSLPSLILCNAPTGGLPVSGQ
jgi:hypothetical protein